MPTLEHVTPDRLDHLHRHAGEDSAAALARAIAEKLELRPQQHSETLRSLRRALKAKGPIGVLLCLQMEHTRGLAHGLIYRHIADEEHEQLPKLERQFGPLPRTVTAYENGFKAEETTEAMPCTLIDDLRWDFSSRLLRSVLVRAEEGQKQSPAVAPRPAPAPSINGTPVKVGDLALVHRDDGWYARDVVPPEAILPLFVPDSGGRLAAEVTIPSRTQHGKVVLRSIRGKLAADNGVMVEQTPGGVALLARVDSSKLLDLLLPIKT